MLDNGDKIKTSLNIDTDTKTAFIGLNETAVKQLQIKSN